MPTEYIKNPNLLIDYSESDSEESLVTVCYKNGRETFKVSKKLGQTLRSLNSKLTKDKFVLHFIENSQYNQQESDTLFDKFLIEKNILIKTDEPVPTKKKNAALKIRITLIKSSAINTISRCLQFFHVETIFKLFAVLSVTFSFLLLSTFIFSDTTSSFYSISSAESAIVVAVIFAGLVFHEFGHASAAYRFGCRNMELGLGWYIYFVVFFVDLSEAWSLDKRKRIIINVAGIYFQSLFISVLFIANMYFESTSIELAYTLLALYNFLNINPFFRLDGYWIVSDYIGINNLRAESYKTIQILLTNPKRIFAALKSEGTNTTHKLLLTYSLSLLLFFPLFIYYLYGHLLPGVFSFFYNLITQSFRSDDAYVYISYAANTIFNLLLGYFILYFTYKNLMLLISYLRNRVAQSQ